jgi:hypothetical protein
MFFIVTRNEAGKKTRAVAMQIEQAGKKRTTEGWIR